MVRFLELAASAVAETYRAVAAWLAPLEGGPLDPRGWHGLTWLLVGLAVVLTLLLLPRARKRRRPDLPEMMISHGELTLTADGAGDGEDAAVPLGSPPRRWHSLKLALSNLNPYPVQLVELAVRTSGARLPVVAEAGAVVPPNGSVDVSAELFDLPGDRGVVELYLFTSRFTHRLFRVVALLEWEPWAQRFRVKGLSSRLEAVTLLASQERQRREKGAFEAARRRQKRQRLARGARDVAAQLLRRSELPLTSVPGPVAAPGSAPGRGREEPREAARTAGTTGPDIPAEQQPRPRAELRFPDEF